MPPTLTLVDLTVDNLYSRALSLKSPVLAIFNQVVGWDSFFDCNMCTVQLHINDIQDIKKRRPAKKHTSDYPIHESYDAIDSRCNDV